MSTLVSILIPAYNAERWIKETIESALNQTWPNKEIIIVDDGSSDNTLQIIKKFESKIVKVIRQENMGGPAARNKALSFAQGDYIQWLDHDDLLAPDKISKQIEYSANVATPLTLYSAPFGQFYYCPERARFVRSSLWQDLTPRNYFMIKFKENIWLQPGAWLVSRELTEMAGPYYELRSPDDDGEYFCRIVANCKKIIFVPEAKAYWRVGNFGSMSKARSNEALAALYISITKSINHFLTLEDSQETRAACMQYLQNRIWHFYPHQQEILAKAKTLAYRLGGNLILPPDEGRKFSLIMNAFGWNTAVYLRSIINRTETSILKNIDKLAYKFRL